VAHNHSPVPASDMSQCQLCHL